MRASPRDTTLQVTPSIRLNGPRYLSVRYDLVSHSRALWHPTWNSDRTVTVDLRTGAVLRPVDHPAPSAHGPAGLSTLGELLREFGAGTCFADGRPLQLDAGALENAAIQFALTGRHLEVLPDGPALGLETACGQPTISIPYQRLGGFLRPDLLSAVAGPSPS
ncbi:hypothetical protein [Thermomonospora catenispora]|uniref:hypothetical protein n=1 Tax=Thermomonospora catenispora TaxID=2493090 RepID=UPI0019D50059|nr:hypothetical protein [Thermomonospora catenispora]